MRYSFTASSLAALTLIAGCSGTGPFGNARPGSGEVPVGGICDTQPAQWAVGQPSTAKAVEDARVRSGALMARVLRPGQMVTKEFNAQRLNLEVDAGGRIVTARCG